MRSISRTCRRGDQVGAFAAESESVKVFGPFRDHLSHVQTSGTFRQPVRLVQKELPVAQGGFRVLVDREHYRLDMFEAVSLPHTHAPDIG
jgi:hypothetical protein